MMNQSYSGLNSPSDSNGGSPGNHTQSSGFDNPWGVSDCEEDDEEDNNHVPDYVPPPQVLPKQRSATRMSAVMNEELQHQQNPVVQRVHSERYSARNVFSSNAYSNTNNSNRETATKVNLSDDGVKDFTDDFDDFDKVDENTVNRPRLDTAATEAEDLDSHADVEYSYSYSSSKHAPSSGPPPAMAAAASAHPASNSPHRDPFRDPIPGYTDSGPVSWQNRSTQRGSPPQSSSTSSRLSVDIEEEPPRRSPGRLAPGSGGEDTTDDRSKPKRNASPNPSSTRKPSLPVKPVMSPTVTRGRSSSLSPGRKSSTLPNDLHSIMGILEDDHSEEEGKTQTDESTAAVPTRISSTSPPKPPSRESSAHTTGGSKLKNLLKEANGQAAGGVTTNNLRHSASGADMLHKKPLTKPPRVGLGAPGAHGITRSNTMPPLSTNIPTSPIVPHSTLVTAKLAALSEFAVNTLVIMEGWMERKTHGILGSWKKVYAVLSESPEHACVLYIYDKMLHTSWGNIPMHLKATIPLYSIDSIETESHRYARGREFTIRKKMGVGPGSGHNSRSPSPLPSPHSGTSGSPQDLAGGYDSDRGSVASGGSAASKDSKTSILSWFGKGPTGASKDMHLRCDDAETRLIWTVLLMKALELANP